MRPLSKTFSLLALLALGFAITAAAAAAPSGAAVGAPAPALSGTDLRGKSLSLAKLKGKVVVVDFWASWCGPCKEEMPVLERLYKKYKANGLVVVGVSVDQDAANAQKFIKEFGVSFPSIHDADHSIADRYKPAKMPTSSIIDRKGTIRFIHAGFKAKDARAMEKEIRSLL